MANMEINAAWKRYERSIFIAAKRHGVLYKDYISSDIWRIGPAALPSHVPHHHLFNITTNLWCQDFICFKPKRECLNIRKVM